MFRIKVLVYDLSAAFHHTYLQAWAMWLQISTILDTYMHTHTYWADWLADSTSSVIPTNKPIVQLDKDTQQQCLTVAIIIK